MRRALPLLLIAATLAWGKSAPAQMSGILGGQAAVVAAPANSCWDPTSVNDATFVNVVHFTAGNCTAELFYGGEDRHFELTPANKTGPTVQYLEVKVEHADPSGSGVPGARIGAFLGSGNSSVRPGFEVYSLGSTSLGTMTHNFASIWTTDSHLTFATGSIVGIVIDNTSPTHPHVYISSDFTTWRDSGDLNDMATCCGPTLAPQGGGSLFVNGDKLTLLTGSAVTHAPPTGQVFPNPTVLP